MRNMNFCVNAQRFVAMVLLPLYGSAGAAPSTDTPPGTITPAPFVAPASSPKAASKKQPVTVWFNAGVGNALKAMEINVQDFQKDQNTYQVEMTLVPEGTYTDRIFAAGKAGDLPCLLFFDGGTGRRKNYPHTSPEACP